MGHKQAPASSSCQVLAIFRAGRQGACSPPGPRKRSEVHSWLGIHSPIVVLILVARAFSRTVGSLPVDVHGVLLVVSPGVRGLEEAESRPASRRGGKLGARIKSGEGGRKGEQDSRMASCSGVGREACGRGAFHRRPEGYEGAHREGSGHGGCVPGRWSRASEGPGLADLGREE